MDLTRQIPRSEGEHRRLDEQASDVQRVQLTDSEFRAETVKVSWGELPLSLQEDIANVHGSLRSGRLEIIKAACSSKSEVWKRLLVFGTEENSGFAIKFVQVNSLPKALFQHLPAPGTLLHTRRSHQGALERGIPVPRPIAQGYIGSTPKVSFFVMERVKNMTPLSDVVSRQLQPHRNPETRKLLRQALAKQLAEVHRKGFFHKDLKPCHCLLQLEKYELEETLFKPWLWLDLDHLELNPLFRRRYRRIGNLYHFYRYLLAPYGESHPREFIVEYLKEAKSNASAKRLADAVEQRFQARGGLATVNLTEAAR